MESGTNKITPIFIFSLPRSGSTLLQKIISSSEHVSSCAEPWFLLPLFYMQKKDGQLTEYSQKISLQALNSLKKNLQKKSVSYDKKLKEFILSIYKELSEPNSKFFLDKTPRYYLIINEISNMFPNAKFIFLFRNPLELISSKLINHNKRMKTLYGEAIDLLHGPAYLKDGYDLLNKKSLKITYSELVNDTKKVIDNLNRYLNISIDNKIIQNLSSINISGTLGDPSLMNNSDDVVHMNSSHKWKKIINSPLKKYIIIRYLKSIDRKYYMYSEIQKNQVIKELRNNKLKLSFHWFLDFFDFVYCYFNLRFKPVILASNRYRSLRYKRLS